MYYNQFYNISLLNCLLAYFGIRFIDSRTVIDFQTSRFIIAARRSFSRRPVSRCVIHAPESLCMHQLVFLAF